MATTKQIQNLKEKLLLEKEQLQVQIKVMKNLSESGSKRIRR